MSKQDQFIEIKDIDSIKRALENAEYEFEEIPTEIGFTITLIDGISFQFNHDGELREVFNG